MIIKHLISTKFSKLQTTFYRPLYLPLLLIFFLCGIVTSNTLAQDKFSTKSEKAIKYYKDGMAKAGHRDVDGAVMMLRAAIKEDKNFIEAYIVMGDICDANSLDSLAIDVYQKGIRVDPEFFPPVYSNLANLEYKNGLYADALEHIKKYLTYPVKDISYRKIANTLLKNCEFAVNAIKHPVPFSPVNLGPAINNKYDQYWPSLSADEQTLVFTELLPIDPNNTQKRYNSQEDFYYSTYENNQWTIARPVGPPLNTNGNEGAQTISADGRLMIFTGCNREGGIGGCDLYYALKTDDTWSVPRNMGSPVNSPYKDTQPSLSSDGKTLYFASNRPGGKGGIDIWKSCLISDNVWGEPVNLGDSINTLGNEQSPFIHSDNQTLYFGSDGWPGMGRSDLFLSRRVGDNQWTMPKNLGYPINTNFDEMGLIVNARGNIAYYSSDRLKENGIDLYSFVLYPEARPTSVSYMKGHVFDAETHLPLVARFELTDLATAKTIMNADANDDGSFLVCIPAGKDYALNVNRPGYLFYSDNFTMTHGDFTKPFLKDVSLKPIKVGEKVVMKNIFYDLESYVVKSESKIELDKLAKLLKDNPTLQIQIGGHTDNTGKAVYNQKLSENRALAVAAYLVQKGLLASRITSKGYGDTQPVAPNDTDEGRAQNRRTEFMVMAK
jgi:outer membrane protein OmpA-like peptidoglycan-associated protein/tetratricopeptide (TPR) repeat protein